MRLRLRVGVRVRVRVRVRGRVQLPLMLTDGLQRLDAEEVLTRELETRLPPGRGGWGWVGVDGVGGVSRAP